MPHILIVCTANICRSPVAEVILREHLQERGLEQWTVSSAGTWAEIERGAAHYSKQLMADRGYDLSGHRARMLDETLLERADLVLCMESGHVEAIKTEFATQAKKVYLLSEMAGRNYNIPDPYGQSLEKYRAMITEVSELVDVGLDSIIELAEANANANDEK
jgi:protein-tyrosine phosphatase